MEHRKLKAVFFDMDGVLYNSMPNHAASWQMAMQLADIDYKPHYSYLNEGRTASATIQWAFNTFFNRTATNHEIEMISSAKTKFMSEMPTSLAMEGMQTLISRLKAEGLNIMVVTGSNQEALINRIIVDFKLQRSNIITGNDVKNGKPNAEPYLKALERCNIQPTEAMVIENAPLGVESAKAANIFTIAVNTGILEDQVLQEKGADTLFANTSTMITNWNQILTQFDFLAVNR